MTKLKWLGLLILLLLLVGVVITWDSQEPSVDWLDTPEVLGQQGRISLRIADSGKGLRSIEVSAIQQDRRRVLSSERYSGSGMPWEDTTPEQDLTIRLDSLPEGEPLVEGPFDIEVIASDQPNLWFFSSSIIDRKLFRLDTTPPRVEVLSGNHYIRQGGTEVVLYRVTEPARASGVRVGEETFIGYPMGGEGSFVCLFALQYDGPVDASMSLWAEDLGGNVGVAPIPKEVIPVRFRKRNIEVSDSFIENVAADIIPNTKQAERKDTLLDTFLEINDRLRRLSHEQIRELSSQSASKMLWNQPFLQLSNSKVESSFADERTYLYQGKPVDYQTHTGFDLASLARSPVEAANDGVVLWADYLGIYGNCVIVDHGLGLMSLYGHLSSIDVKKGETVRRGQTLGRTGATGLAGGDHLHFSMILQGVQVNPLEWWDPNWVELHVFSKLGRPGSP